MRWGERGGWSWWWARWNQKGVYMVLASHPHYFTLLTGYTTNGHPYRFYNSIYVNTHLSNDWSGLVLAPLFFSFGLSLFLPFSPSILSFSVFLATIPLSLRFVPSLSLSFTFYCISSHYVTSSTNIFLTLCVIKKKIRFFFFSTIFYGLREDTNNSYLARYIMVFEMKRKDKKRWS